MRAPGRNRSRLIIGLALPTVLVVGPVNFVLYRVCYATYGEEYAFFVSQGVNLLYVVYGGAILLPKMWFGDEITPAMRALPQRRFAFMAILDCCGTFLAAMGAVHTPGQVQSLLNQSLIPCTMIASRVFNHTRYTAAQCAGAAVILLGAAVVLSPELLGAPAGAPPAPGGGGAESAAGSRALSNALYFLANVPMACSAVYKERRFAGDQVHVLYLTQCVSCYQFLFGFVLAPLQAVPGVSTAAGQSPAAIAAAFRGGYECFRARAADCPPREGTTWLLLGYCAVNFVLNTTGLVLTKHGSAALNAISYALILPLTTVSYSLPFLGAHREELRAPTLVGLLVVLAGFLLYERDEILGARALPSQSPAPQPRSAVDAAPGAGGTPAKRGERAPLLAASLPTPSRRERAVSTDSYQERLILVHVPVTRVERGHDVSHAPTSAHSHGAHAAVPHVHRRDDDGGATHRAAHPPTASHAHAPAPAPRPSAFDRFFGYSLSRPQDDHGAHGHEHAHAHSPSLQKAL